MDVRETARFVALGKLYLDVQQDVLAQASIETRTIQQRRENDPLNVTHHPEHLEPYISLLVSLSESREPTKDLWNKYKQTNF